MASIIQNKETEVMISPINYNRLLNIICIIFSVALVIINVYRAFNISITHDEAYSYFNYVSKSLSSIILFNDNPTANNHLGNTLFSKLFITLFTNNLFFLRLTAVLSHIVYLFFSFKLSRLFFSSSEMAILSFILLQLNPYLFEFWSLSRGYGPSIAALLVFFYFGALYLKTNRVKNLVYSHIFLSIAVIFSFVIINVVIAYYGFLILCYVFKIRKLSLREFIISTIFTFSNCFICYLYGVVLKKHNQLYFGGEDGFINDSLLSLINLSFGSTLNYHTSYLLTYFVSFCVATGIFKFFAFGKSFKQLAYSFFIIILLNIVILVYIQYYVVHTKFLIERTALFLYPILIIVILILLNEAFRSRLILLNILIFVTSIFFIFNFKNGYKVNHTTSWDFDRFTPKIYSVIENTQDSYSKSSVYVTPILNQSFMYYNIAKGRSKYIIIGDDLSKQTNLLRFNYLVVSESESLLILKDFKLIYQTKDNKYLLFKKLK